MKKILLFLLLTALCLNLAACDSGGEESTSAASSETVSTQQLNAGAVSSSQVSYDDDDLNSDWDDSAVMVTLNGDSADISGNGAAASDGNVVIQSAGTYVLSGTLDDGCITIAAGKDDVIHLVLNGASISCSDGPAILSTQAGKVVVTLAPNTQNSLSDGKTYADQSAEAPTAALYVQDDLTINGSGSLSVTGNSNDGITSKDDLKLVSGDITVNSADDGIIGRDLLALKEAQIDITSQGDGMKSTNDTDATKGFMVLSGGNVTISAQMDGIQAETSILIEGGTYTITTADGAGEVAQSFPDRGSGWDMQQETTDEVSTKGIKAVSDLTVSGGMITIDSYDDALHSNNSITVSGGKLTLASGDDGIHADTTLTISGGNTEITQSYEGLESTSILLSGGEATVTASDDGVNASDGSGSSMGPGGNMGSGGGMGGTSPENAQPGDATATAAQSTSSASPTLTITGGTYLINADGAGMESNGTITMEGGTVLVNGPENDGNSALDFETDCSINGGILLAAGSAGMLEMPSDNGSQPSMVITFSENREAGSLVSILDADGKTILSFAPQKQYRSLIVSSPELQQGKSYSIYTDGSNSGEEQGGLYTGGSYSGGTLLEECTLSETVTTIGSSAGMGGMGGMGGGRPGQRPNGGTPPDGTPGEMPGEMPEGMEPGGAMPGQGENSGTTM